MKILKKIRKNKGTTLIELLIAIAVIAIGISAVLKMIITTQSAIRLTKHRDIARIIAQSHLECISKESKENYKYLRSNITTDCNCELPFNFWCCEDHNWKYFITQEISDPKVFEWDGTNYIIRDMIDETPKNDIDDFTGQPDNLRVATVTVGWSEKNGRILINQISPGDKNWENSSKIRWKIYTESMLVGPYKQVPSGCVGPPVVRITGFEYPNGTTITPQTGINNCQDIVVLVDIEDPCSTPRIEGQLYYWYCNQAGRVDTQFEPLQGSGGQGQYTCQFPAELLCNSDVLCGDADGCLTTDAFEEPYDIYFSAYAIDRESEDPSLVRESFSDTKYISVSDSTPPFLYDYSSRLVGASCSGFIYAKIYDCANGTASIDPGYPKAYIRILHPLEVTYTELTLTSGPDAENRYIWNIDSFKIKDHSALDSGSTPYDAIADLEYYVEVYDNCGNYSRTDTATCPSATPLPLDSTSTCIVVTEFDENPPLIVLTPGQIIEDCAQYSSTNPIIFPFEVMDECGVLSGSITYWSLSTGVKQTVTDTKSGLNNIEQFFLNIQPQNRDDMAYYYSAEDNFVNISHKPDVPIKSEAPYILHLAGALYWEDTPDGVDPTNILYEDAVLEGTSNETVVLTLKNFRSADIILDKLQIDEPKGKEICLPNGTTSIAVVYVNSVTIETYSDTGILKISETYLWHWETDSPTPGTREYAPVQLEFRKDNPDILKLEPKNIAIIKIDFMDRATNEPVSAQPASMENTKFDITFIPDQTEEYKCDNNLQWEFISDINYCPYADYIITNKNGVASPLFCDKTVYFDASLSADCDNDPLGFSWYFGDGNLASGETTTHTYSSSLLGGATYIIITSSVVVSDPEPCATTKIKEITLLESYCSPLPTVTIIGCSTVKLLETRLDAELNSGYGNISDYFWDFGDGTTGKSYGNTTTSYITHTFEKSTSNTVTVTVEDECFNTSTATITVNCDNNDCSCP